MATTTTNKVNLAVEEGVVLDAETKKQVRRSSAGSDTSSYDTMAIISFLLGLLSLCSCFCGGIFTIPIPLLSLGLYYMGGNKSSEYASLSMAGAIISAVSIACIVCSTAFYFAFYGASFFASLS